VSLLREAGHHRINEIERSVDTRVVPPGPGPGIGASGAIAAPTSFGRVVIVPRHHLGVIVVQHLRHVAESIHP